MQIALFRGKSFVSRAIEFLTRFPESHAAFLFDQPAQDAAIKLVHSLKRFTSVSVGSIVEAWEGGVKNSSSISTLHTPGTPVDVYRLKIPLQPTQERDLVLWLDSIIGDPYSYWNVLKFVTKRPGNLDGSWFCSELVCEGLKLIGAPIFDRVSSWEVPPGWIKISTELELEKSVLTS